MRRLTPAGVSTMMVAVVGLLVAAYFAKLMRSDQPHIPPTTQAAVIDFRSVPTAAVTLEPGSVITAAQLVTSRVRADSLTPDAFVQDRSVIGRTTKDRIVAGSVVRSGQLCPAVEATQAKISPGMRAVSIAISRGLSSTNGLLKPGLYVDLYLTPKEGGVDQGRGPGDELTLLRGVRLLALTPSTSPQTGDVVTLELTPAQATALILAREKVNVAVAYNPDGKGDGGIALKDRDRTPVDETARRPTPTAGKPFTAEVFKGTIRSTQQFDVRSVVEDVPATSMRFDSAPSAPRWSRKAPATPVPLPPPERISVLPDRFTPR
jgi:pilus assembly protein CpaB